jgi:hypothetical protein
MMMQDEFGLLDGLGMDDELGYMPGFFDWQRDRQEVEGLLQIELQSAITGMAEHVTKLAIWRRAYDLKPDPEREPPFPGAANYVKPMTRSKIDGAAAYLGVALDEDPFFTVRARTAQLEPVRAALEEYMDLRMDHLETGMGQGIRTFVHQSVRESLVVGVCVARCIWEEVVGARGQRVRGRNKLDLVPLEDFLVSPVTVTRLEDAFMVAHRFWLPYWRLDQMADSGVLNADYVEKLRGQGDEGGPNQTYNEDQGHHGYNSGSPESRMVEIYECWVQWRGQMWRFWFHKGSNCLLRAEPNQYNHGRAPFALIRHDPKPNYLFGSSFSELLEQTQIELDTLTNQRIDTNSYAISPLVGVRPGSLMARWLRKNAITPGAVVEGDPNDFFQIQIAPASQASMQDEQVLWNMADKTTLPDIAMSQPLTKRDPTATEVNRDQSFVQAKSANWLRNLHGGLRDLAWLMYYNLHQYEVSQSSVQVNVETQMGPMPMPMAGLTIQTGDSSKDIIASEMFLDGIDIEVNGRETQTAKAERATLAGMLLQQVVPAILQGTTKNPQVWTVLKMLLDANNVKNWREILGDKPTEEQMQAEQMMAQMQQGGPAPPGGMA